MARSLNKVELIGNLTRDPELRYTPQGTAVCTFGLATNRQWVTEAGEKREEAEFHRIVAWNKLAEICSQLLTKGRKVYIEGRLQTRSWTGQDGAQRTATEIVASDMIILDSRREAGEMEVPEGEASQVPSGEAADAVQETPTQKPERVSEDKPGKKKASSKKAEKTKAPKKKEEEDEVDSEEIPF
jgi:single-strand DNA-binding protein